MTQRPTDETVAATAAPSRSHVCAPALARGSAVGRYVVLDRLGAGGMGIVFAAYDPELDRKVAIKLLHPSDAGGAAASEGRARLLREAQSLARLSHPNVVAVHDVGTLGEQVYVAMEFVAGRTLAAWLRETPRRWVSVLATMRAAAEGLVAAHAAGLVHRDFKPENLMVGEDGRVRVMDFGLARAGTDRAVTDRGVEASRSSAIAVELTTTGAVLGTPAYMAPEQHLGLATDARTDQFSFCVTMWEALYGERPFSGKTLAELSMAVTAGRPRAPPPGRHVPSWLRRVLERGFSVDPGRRHESMQTIAVLLDRGVARRRRAWLLGSTGALALAGFSAWGAAQLDAERRRSRCETEAASIDEVWNDGAKARLRDALVATGVSYAETTFEHATPFIDEHVVEWAREYEELCVATEVQRARDVELWMASRDCLASRRGELAAIVDVLTNEADATAVQRAVAAAAGLARLEPCRDDAWLARRPPEPEDEQLGELRRRLWRAGSLQAAGKYADAFAVAQAVVDAAEAAGHERLQRGALLAAGRLAERKGAFDESESMLGQAFELALQADDDDDALAATIALVHTVGDRAARYDEALWWGRIARGFVARLGATDGPQSAALDNAIANVHRLRGSFVEAQRYSESALAVLERTLGPDHPDVADVLSGLAVVHYSRSSYDEAVRLQARALAIRERALGDDHPAIANSLNNLAIVYYEQGSYDEAARLHERALAIKERTLGRDHPDVATSLNNLGNAYRARGSYDEAVPLLERALVLWERAHGPDHLDLAHSLINLALVQHARGAFDEAGRLHARALALRERALGADHPELVHPLVGLAEVALAAGRPQQARTHAERAVELCARHPENPALRSKAQFLLAQALWSTGNRARAAGIARGAHESIVAAGQGFEAAQADIGRWLAEHGTDRR